MYGSSAPVAGLRVASPSCVTPPAVVKVPVMNRRPPDIRIEYTTPFRTGGLNPETIEPFDRLSSVMPLDLTPLTVLN